MDFAFTLSGFIVGAIVGLTGVGGGSLMTPLLVLLFGIHPAVAVGTDLLYAAVTKAGGTVSHALQGHVDWSVTRRLATGSIPAALLTIAYLQQFPLNSPEITSAIKIFLGIALLLTALALVFRQRITRLAQAQTAESWLVRHTRGVTVLTGAVLGVLVSLTSVGAGALGVTALFFLYPRLTTIRIVGSDIAHAVPLTLVAGLGHWVLGSVDWALLGALLLGSLPGIWLGSRVAARVPDVVLRPLLASLLVLVGGKLIVTP